MKKAILLLADGRVFKGSVFGAEGETIGEVCFNTGMTGYQEILTDPSYCRQIVTMTAPHIGNYGINDEDVESLKIQVAGFVIKEESPITSNWRSKSSISDYLKREKIVGVVPLDKKSMIPEGSHLVRDAKAKLPNPKLGHISASCWSVEYNNPFSLAILKDGKKKIGEKLYALSPLKNKSIPVEIVSSHYVDPKGERVRS